MRRLEGKIAFITGAAFGNGRGMAVRFAGEGADIVVADVAAERSAETAQLVEAAGQRALVHPCDVSRQTDVTAAITAGVEHFGRIDIAVANAGVCETNADCLRMTESEWQRTIGVNLSGAFFTLQAAARQMIAQGRGGRLLAVSSVMSEWGSGMTPAYSASKAGVRQLVRSFAMACGKYGITCNGLAPGLIETGMTERLRAEPMLVNAFIDRTPVGRVGMPEDVASLAAYLASDEASFITGALMVVDGGVLAGPYSATAEAAMAALARRE